MKVLTKDPEAYLEGCLKDICASIPKDAIEVILKDSVFLFKEGVVALDYEKMQGLKSIEGLYQVLRMSFLSPNKGACEQDIHREFTKLLIFMRGKTDDMGVAIQFSTDLFVWMQTVEVIIKANARLIESIRGYNNKSVEGLNG